MRPPTVPSDAEDRRERPCGPNFGRLFGAGGPFARQRGSRMFDAGALRLVVLGFIADEPRHGYEIIKGLRQRFQGAYSPSPGAIYPMLRLLEEAGLVSSQSRGPRRLFTVTEAGRAYLRDQRAELEKINAQVEAAAAPIGESGVGEAIRALRAALFDKMRQGGLSEDRARKLTGLLMKARDEIEKI
ncbi:MAG: PadR family transcriptional regulator [Roseiarcus sp.]